MAAPSLNSNTIAYPATYEPNIGYRGGARSMADGTIVRDLVNSSYKRTIRMTFRLITEAELDTLIASYHAAADDAGVIFTDHNGDSYTVTQPVSATELQISQIRLTSSYRYNVTMVLQEV